MKVGSTVALGGLLQAVLRAGGGISLPPLSTPLPAVNAFWVTVQRTEAAERCELRGSYVLKAERDSLILKDPRTSEILYVWPYRLLRRYGRDKVGVWMGSQDAAHFPWAVPGCCGVGAVDSAKCCGCCSPQ